MGTPNSRRAILRSGLAAVGFSLIPGRSGAAAFADSNTIEIESEGGGVAAYEFTVSGSLRQVDGGDQVAGTRAYGHVGPDSGADTFAYSGDLTGLSLAGPAQCRRNGYRLRPSVLPAPDGVPTAADFPANAGSNTLRIESEGGGFGAYEFETTGSVRQLDDGDQVAGTRAYGHVGSERGADEFEITGEVTRFSLAGPASVSLGGQAVTDGGGPRTAVRASGSEMITVAPETRVLFESVARGYRGEYADSAWYVDGQRIVGPDAFYGHLGSQARRTFTSSFDSTGTHRVRAELYDDGKAYEDDAEPIGTVKWTVEVAPDGEPAPTVRRARPSADTVTVSRDDTEPRQFVAEASDESGDLDRMVWWISQCDAVIDVTRISGSNAAASLSYAPTVGCPLAARAIDKRGAIGESDAWLFEADD